ncbi:MAG: alpha/beta hydrolase-fold protein [Fusobacteriota bacterium]
MKKILMILALSLSIIGCKTAPEVKESVKKEKQVEVFKKEVDDFKVDVGIQSAVLSWKLEEKENVDKIEILRKQSFSNRYKVVKELMPNENSVKLELPEFMKMDVKVRLISKKGEVSRGVEMEVIAELENVVLDTYEGRNMQIFLPDSYSENSDKKYPVMYMHDGQNLFTSKTGSSVHWDVKNTVKRLIKEDKINDIIVVGIYNSSDRAKEYVPYATEDWDTGGAAEYSEFIIDEIIPYVESKYRIKSNRENRGIMGSSFGGISALWMGLNYSDTFSMVGAFSPSIWTGNHQILKEIEKKDIKIWLDTGEFEFDPAIRNLIDIMEEKGYEYGDDFVYYEHIGAYHNEEAWAERYEDAILFLQGDENPKLKDIDLQIIGVRDMNSDEVIGKVVNTVAEFENGLNYSLMNLVDYEVSPKDILVETETVRNEVYKKMNKINSEIKPLHIPRGLILEENTKGDKIKIKASYMGKSEEVIMEKN